MVFGADEAAGAPLWVLETLDDVSEVFWLLLQAVNPPANTTAHAMLASHADLTA
ncbi:MAG: hypothetical protein GIX00_07390 [Candidatus Eremiobacteraeota bacterium]|nr:hypothetical protein [Candidatus Eremiobacteraeota bacterium]MBC5808409.1 hypothetical protein [Candidatus Eremiobacteraeota bacterium]